MIESINELKLTKSILCQPKQHYNDNGYLTGAAGGGGCCYLWGIRN